MVAEVAPEATTSSKVVAARVAGRSTIGALTACVCARHVDERNDRMIKRTKRPTSSRKDTMCEMLWQLRCHGIRLTSARQTDWRLRLSERS